MRKIPSTMATQHPDNASAAYWEKDGDGFVSVHEELAECVSCFKDLGVGEFMWDWEGKYADEAVIDRLFASFYDFCKKNQIGKDIFLTFRLPNIWHEKGYSLLRAFMVILTSEDFADDLRFKSPPLFEVILPMVERAEQLEYIQTAFKKLAEFKTSVINHRKKKNNEYLEIIPLVEGVDNQLGIRKLLEKYLGLHKKHFKSNPAYIRPFLARSDPALISGLVATVLANKVALSEIEAFTDNSGVPAYPIIGAGSLTFRGGLNPGNLLHFINEYAGIKTATIQSAFRYDYSLSTVKKAVQELNRRLPSSKTRRIDARDLPKVERIIRSFADAYQMTIPLIIKDLQNVFEAVPRRRERRLHVGFLSYKRNLGTTALPRAINFTAGLYSIGIPPELIGTGRALAKLEDKDLELLSKHYLNIKKDLLASGKFLNKENLKRLAGSNRAWRLIAEDVELIENIFNITLGPKNANELIHSNLSANALLLKNNHRELSNLIAETGKLRHSLG